MEVVIRKGEKQLLSKLIRKGSSYEIVGFENEVVIFELSFKWSKDDLQLE